MLNKSNLLLICIILIVIVCITLITIYILKKQKNKSKSKFFYNNNFKNSLLTKVTSSINLNALNRDLEPFGFSYNPTQDLFYSIMNGWQKKCGYCQLYDETAILSNIIIDCEPIRFEYDGKRWLIEFWKGQYGITSGCEIGIYTTSRPDFNIPGVFNGTFYDCANPKDYLFMSFELIKDGKRIFSRTGVHWWLTAFRLGEFSYPHELTMKIRIRLKNSKMLNAFLEAFEKAGYSEKEYTVTNNTISFTYKTPHSTQSLSRNYVAENLAQTVNRKNCESYQLATKNYSHALTKLGYLKTKKPTMYKEIINVGNTIELYKGYESFESFLNSNK